MLTQFCKPNNTPKQHNFRVFSSSESEEAAACITVICFQILFASVADSASMLWKSPLVSVSAHRQSSIDTKRWEEGLDKLGNGYSLRSFVAFEDSSLGTRKSAGGIVVSSLLLDSYMCPTASLSSKFNKFGLFPSSSWIKLGAATSKTVVFNSGSTDAAVCQVVQCSDLDDSIVLATWKSLTLMNSSSEW